MSESVCKNRRNWRENPKIEKDLGKIDDVGTTSRALQAKAKEAHSRPARGLELQWAKQDSRQSCTATCTANEYQVSAQRNFPHARKRAPSLNLDGAALLRLQRLLRRPDRAAERLDVTNRTNSYL